MSDRFWAKIWIGGPIADGLEMEDLYDMLKKQDLLNLSQWSITINCKKDLENYLNPDTGLLEFEDNEANNGWFEDLEDWLIKKQIEFDRQSDGYCEYNPEMRSYRRSIGEICKMLDHDGIHVVRAYEIRDVINASQGDFNVLKYRLEDIIRDNMPPLQPAFGIVSQTVISADELRRRNTDPLSTSCAVCGGDLKDPGLGPNYKHCPKCEP